MNVFDRYAHYYDLLYQDKDYVGEVQFINQILQAVAPKAKSLLELGCGTGTHAILLAQSGYAVHGVDLSVEMLDRAKANTQALGQLELEFSQGDMCEINLARKFDAVISLFHVINYQVTNERLQSAFQTAKNHLLPDGVFIFDSWYGAAVLSDRPATRIKRLENDQISVIRMAEPIMYPNQNLVEVNYQVLIKDKISGNTEEIRETHPMRYLFKPEIDLFLANIDMEVVKFGEWMSDRPPGCDTWGVYCVAKLKSS